MVKALEKANQTVPQELLLLAQEFKSKVDRGEAHWSSSGFVGKGFTFDPSEMNESQKVMAMQKKAYEAEQGIVACKDEFGEDLDTEETVFPSSSEVPITDMPLNKVTSDILPVNNEVNSASALNLDVKASLAKAKFIAQQLVAGRKPPVSALGSNVNYYAEELDINDYPAQVCFE